MDLLKRMEELALASRLKRLSDRMMLDVAALYKSYGIDFEARWFPIFFLLKDGQPRSIVDIAKEIGITHPAVNQLSNEMLAKGIITSEKDSKDKRKRFLQISPEGEKIILSLETLWEEIAKCMQELLDYKSDFLEQLKAIEEKLNQESIKDRIEKRLQLVTANRN